MDFPHAQIIRALEQCGAVFEELSTSAQGGYHQQWVEAYGDFYGPGFRRLRGVRAISEAQRLNDGGYLLVPCRDPAFTGWKPVGTAYRCHSERLPDLTEASHRADVFISPEEFTWTLLYGHEVDVFGGPDFSCPDWRVPPSIERAQKRKWSR